MKKVILIYLVMMTTVVAVGSNPFFKPFNGPHETALLTKLK